MHGKKFYQLTYLIFEGLLSQIKILCILSVDDFILMISSEIDNFYLIQD